MMLISVVVPVHNEQSGLERFWESLGESLQQCPQRFEAILVDDGSTDSTWQIITGLSNSDHGIPIKGIRLSRNFGKEAAILAGLRDCSGDAAIVLDADLQHPPTLIPDMIARWNQGQVPIVEAVKRERQQESGLRRLGAGLYYRAFALSSGMDMQGSTDFKLLDRRVVEQYTRLPEVSRFFRGLTQWLGYESVALEFTPPARVRGSSSWNLGQLLKLARSTIISFSSLPLRLVTWIGGLGILFSFGLTLQTLWYKWQGLAEEGFPTVILLILGMGSMILLGLGLIGEYVAEIYQEVKKRPAYVIAQSIASGQRATDHTAAAEHPRN
ncbi:MAG: glycosyltransferase family 2 protein [Candidatus Thiodiazotropha sp.]